MVGDSSACSPELMLRAQLRGTRYYVAWSFAPRGCLFLLGSPRLPNGSWIMGSTTANLAACAPEILRGDSQACP